MLRLLDLGQAKAAVLNSLTSADAQRGHWHAIDEFVSGTVPNRDSHSTEPVVLRYRMHLDARKLAPGTVNLRLGAVRRLAYGTSDAASSALT